MKPRAAANSRPSATRSTPSRPRCVDDATLSIRFEPAGKQALSQEHDAMSPMFLFLAHLLALQPHRATTCDIFDNRSRLMAGIPGGLRFNTPTTV